jgi:hypothetical protein
MGTPFNLTIQSVSSAFGSGSTIPLNGAATINGVSYLTFTLAGASTAAAGSTVDYSILDTGASEIGTATFISSANTLTSRTPTKSTNGNAAITASSAALILGTIRAESLTPFIVAGQLLGTATNDNANAGNVGEFISATIFSTTPTTLTSATPTNLTSVNVSAGDWELYGMFGVSPSSAISVWKTCISSASATFITDFTAILGDVSLLNAIPVSFSAPGRRISVAASTTYYLVVQANFSSSLVGYGYLNSRRAR